ncbi:MAG: Hpt domain-containing protein [Candidatus Eisenbacteria bacterium]
MNEDLQKQLINDLLIESFEGLDRFDQYLLDLEKGEGGSETLNGIFRVIHTIKGTSGCIALTKIEKLAHVGENLLSLLRDGKLTVKPLMITALLRLSDGLREMLRTLERDGHEGENEYGELKELLTRLQDPDAVFVDETRGSSWGLFDDDDVVAETPVPASAEPETEYPAPIPLPVAHVTPAPIAAAAEPQPESVATAAAPAAPGAPEPATRAGRGSVTDSAIRVDVGQLDRLMNLVGELVLARNQIVQHSSDRSSDGLAKASQRLNIITTELQESVMKTRMQPIGNVWSKFPRVVRDLASELGKDIHFVMEGNETELDRTIIEAIKDPLTHIVRNSVDHGIETPELRRQGGKSPRGSLVMRLPRGWPGHHRDRGRRPRHPGG